MPILVDDVYKKSQDILNKNQNGILGPKEWTRLAVMANTNLFNRYYGSAKAYRPEKPLARINYAETQLLSEALKPFIMQQVPIPVTVGVANTPADKIHLVNIRHNYTVSGTPKTASFRRIEWDRLDAWLTSAIDAPTLAFPMYIEGDDNLNIFPTSITSVLVTYLRKPIDPIWNYTIVSNRPVFNATGSVNFEWDVSETNNLVMEIVSLAAASLKDNDLVSYSESTKRGEA